MARATKKTFYFKLQDIVWHEPKRQHIGGSVIKVGDIIEDPQELGFFYTITKAYDFTNGFFKYDAKLVQEEW